MPKVLLYYFFFLLLPHPLLAQVPAPANPLSLKRQFPADSTKMLSPQAELAVDFPQINIKPYYVDKRKLRAITKLEKKKNWTKALPLLQDYVSKFGIENFYKNTSLLWRLAQ